MPQRHHRHRTLRLRRHRHPSVSTCQPDRPRSLSASDSDSSSKKQTDIELVALPEVVLEERRRRAQDANKLAKARAMLDSEVQYASTDSTMLRPTTTALTVSSDLGSVTSEREKESYLERLAAQAEAEANSSTKRKRGADGDDDDDSIHDRSRYGAYGIVRRVVEKHHRKVQKREKQRRMDRLRRIAALDPLKEGERQHGQAKETTFMALIRKYGSMAQEEARSPTNERLGASTSAEQEPAMTDASPTSESSSFDDEHSAYLVDTLEVVDPGVSAAGHLSNIGNSLMFPNIPGLYDRRPAIDLPAERVDADTAEMQATLQLEEGRHPAARAAMTSQAEDDLHLDAYVHELLTKKQKFKRAMQGVWAFLKTPLGVIAGIYGFLVVFGGAALVLFLVGAIDKGKNKDFWVEVFSQFENGLFTITGVGLIPWRLRDTWRMAWIAYYQHLTWRLRKKQGLPRLVDKNDVPSVVAAKQHGKKKKASWADEDSSDEQEGVQNMELSPDVVLSPHQAAHLHALQIAFAESQSWYRPHETFTHHAFSISLALWITICNDLNSLFQCLLCGYMWGYATHYRSRPAWSTGIFMPCSFLAGIAAGVLIWKGGEKSKKKREVEEKLLAAFAKDVDARVEAMRRERAVSEDKVGVAGTGSAWPAQTRLTTVDEVGPNAEQRIDLDALASKIADQH